MRRRLWVIGWMSLLVSPTMAQAHFFMEYPISRDPNGQFQTVPPCGGQPAGEPGGVLAPNATLNVQWNVFIAHPGHFRVSLSDDPNTFGQNVLADNIPSTNTTGDMNYTVTLPATPCQCVLQLVQVNTSSTDPSTPSGYTEYVACADTYIIAPVDPSTTGTVATTGGGATPTTTTGGTTTGGATTTPTDNASQPTNASAGCASAPPSLHAVFLALAARTWRRRRVGRCPHHSQAGVKRV